MTYRVATATDAGRVRSGNEDTVRVASFHDGSWALVVCDGMGGHDAGEVASDVAARRILAEIATRADDPDVWGVLHEALLAARDEVEQESEALGSDMGTTAVVARLIGDRLWFGWVGDSRIFVGRQGAVIAASVDHTVVQAEIEAGLLDPEGDHRNHPEAHVLTQAIGGSGHALSPSVTPEPVRLEAGDVIVLSSDGLHDLVDADEALRLVAGREAPDAAQALVDEANGRGGHDNISVVVALYDGGLGRREETPAPRARYDALATPTPPPPPALPVRGARPPPWLLPALVGLAAVLVVALATTWLGTLR